MARLFKPYTDYFSKENIRKLKALKKAKYKKLSRAAIIRALVEEAKV